MKRVIIPLAACVAIALGIWLLRVYPGSRSTESGSSKVAAASPAPAHQPSDATPSGRDGAPDDRDHSPNDLVAASHAEVDEELAAPAHYAHDLPALRHGKVSREIIEMLALDPAAVDRLDGLLRSAADLLMEIEVERVEVVHASDEEVVLRVPAYAEEGLGVADIILRGVLGILGEEKGMRFMESMESSVPLFWNDFGHFDRTITFSAKPRGAGQYWLEFRQDVPPDQVDAYYGHPVFGEVSVWPGFAMLLDVHSADFAGPGVGRSASFLPLLPVSMRALFELIEDWSSEQQQSSRR